MTALPCFTLSEIIHRSSLMANWMIMEHRRENKSLGDKSVPRTNPTCVDLELNLGLRGERTVTKCFSRGTVL